MLQLSPGKQKGSWWWKQLRAPSSSAAAPLVFPLSTLSPSMPLFLASYMVFSAHEVAATLGIQGRTTAAPQGKSCVHPSRGRHSPRGEQRSTGVFTKAAPRRTRR